MDLVDILRTVDQRRKTKVRRIKMTEVHRVVNLIKLVTVLLNQGILLVESGLEVPLPEPRTKLGKAFS